MTHAGMPPDSPDASNPTSDVAANRADRVAAALDCDIDLLDLRAASTVMQYVIVTTGRRLFGREPDASAFECFVMQSKLDLDEARAPLLADIAREGRIHGR